VAFYTFLAIPAAVVVLVSSYRLFVDPDVLEAQVDAMRHVLPDSVIDLLTEPHSSQTLEISLLIALAVDLWSIRTGSSCMLTAFDLASGERKKRSFFKQQVIVLMLAGSLLFVAVVSLALIVVLPVLLNAAPFGRVETTIILLARWPVLFALISFEIALIYRFAPSGAEQRWRWMSWGTAVAALLWLGGSALFSIYVSLFSSQGEGYGTLGTVMALLAWLELSALVVLFGARIDAEIDRRSAARSTTAMQPQLYGQRDE
jgi:membrane protein